MMKLNKSNILSRIELIRGLIKPFELTYDEDLITITATMCGYTQVGRIALPLIAQIDIKYLPDMIHAVRDETYISLMSLIHTCGFKD